jgi:hypothetical protein
VSPPTLDLARHVRADPVELAGAHRTQRQELAGTGACCVQNSRNRNRPAP